jgi:hypothetical protein
MGCLMDDKLMRRTRRIAGRVEAFVKKEFSVRWWNLKQEDEIRCLRLEQWEDRYKVSLRFILTSIVPIWKRKFARYAAGAFGVKIPTLVGEKSEEILKGKIEELFPDGENIRQWKATQQQRQWALFREGIRQKENWEEPGQAVRDYQQRMEREREARKKFEKKAKLRPYRGNPWIS